MKPTAALGQDWATFLNNTSSWGESIGHPFPGWTRCNHCAKETEINTPAGSFQAFTSPSPDLRQRQSPSSLLWSNQLVCLDIGLMVSKLLGQPDDADRTAPEVQLRSASKPPGLGNQKQAQTQAEPHGLHYLKLLVILFTNPLAQRHRTGAIPCSTLRAPTCWA